MFSPRVLRIKRSTRVTRNFLARFHGLFGVYIRGMGEVEVKRRRKKGKRESRCTKASNSGSDLLVALNDSNLSWTVMSSAYFHVERCDDPRYDHAMRAR